MHEYCLYADDFLGNIPTMYIDECDFMPESCSCVDCPYYKLVEVQNG